MSIMLGKLTIEQMEQRAGVEFSPALKQYMVERHQEAAVNVRPGKWHCFDLPFFLVCGDMETAQAIYGHLQPLTAHFKKPMQIGVTP